MKNLTKSIFIAALACSSIGFANAASEFVAGNNNAGTEVCIAAAQGSRLKLLKTLNESGVSKRYVVKNVKCNEQDFITFVEQYGNNVEKINNFMTNGAYSENLEMRNLVVSR
jgi:hypothetical protein